MTDVYPSGTREFKALTVTDGTTPVTDYETAVIRYPLPVPDPDATDWVPAATFTTATGVWLDGLDPGTYRIFARYDGGPGNEAPIVDCGFVYSVL